MAKGIRRPKTAKRRQISRAAKQLIKSAIQRYGSESKAARALGLPNPAQLNQMRRGLIGETPAMKAAVLRAKERSRRAFLFIREPESNGDKEKEIDRAELRVLVDQLNRLLEH